LNNEIIFEMLTNAEKKIMRENFSKVIMEKIVAGKY